MVGKKGLDGFKTIGRIMNGTFPDVVVTEEDLIAGEDKVIERSSVKGSHLGDQLGLPPTGKKLIGVKFIFIKLRMGKLYNTGWSGATWNYLIR